MQVNISVTKKQKLFIDAAEDEVLFGGAAGGGKSYGHLAFPSWGRGTALVAVDEVLFVYHYSKIAQVGDIK